MMIKKILNLASPVSKCSAAHLEMLQIDRLKFLHNPLIAHLHINSLRNKVIYLGEILKGLPLVYLVIGETKLNESFSKTKFKLNGYKIRLEEIEINMKVEVLSTKD